MHFTPINEKYGTAAFYYSTIELVRPFISMYNNIGLIPAMKLHGGVVCNPLPAVVHQAFMHAYIFIIQDHE